MSLCCNTDVKGGAVKILDHCQKIKEQTSAGVGVLHHVSMIESEAHALLTRAHRGYETKGVER